MEDRNIQVGQETHCWLYDWIQSISYKDWNRWDLLIKTVGQGYESTKS